MRKEFLFSLLTLSALSFSFPLVSQADEWRRDANGWWYEIDEDDDDDDDDRFDD